MAYRPNLFRIKAFLLTSFSKEVSFKESRGNPHLCVPPLVCSPSFGFAESHELAFVDSKTNTPACHLERSKQLSVVCVVEPDVRRALRRSEISRDSLYIVIFVIKSNLLLRKPRKPVSRSRPQAVALTVFGFSLRPVRVRLRSG